MKSFPVLILAYARDENVIALIDQITEQNTSHVYLSVDGAKNSKIATAQNRMISKSQEIVRRRGLKLSVWHRLSNLGVGASVPRGIDWFFSREDAGIILEDDLLVENDFFAYVTKSMDILENSKSITMICGSRFIPEGIPPTALLSSYPMIWGWATTKKKWQALRQVYYEDQIFPSLFPRSPEQGYWSVGEYRAKVGLVDTWDIPLVAKMKREGWFSLIPPTNLVTNIGVDQFAAHTRVQEFPIGHATKPLPEEFTFPVAGLDISAEAYDNFLNSKVFKIRKRHLLAPLKLLLSTKWKQRNESQELKHRIETSLLPEI